MKTNDVIKYYKRCYEEDSADLNLWNLLKLKQDDRLILEGKDELGSGFLPRLPINSEFGEQMTKRVAIYQRERVLLYTSLIFVGRIDVRGEKKLVVSPLVYKAATIESDGVNYYVSTDIASIEINESLIQTLTPEGQSGPEIGDFESYLSPALWTAWFKQCNLKLDSF